MKAPKCKNCIRDTFPWMHRRSFHPSMKMLYMRSGDRYKRHLIQVGWICPNCGSIKDI